MKHHREFEIPWLGLKEGVHEYKYELDDKVIEELGHEHPDFENLKVSVDLTFDKKSSFFLLHFDIDGTVDVPCDRCGDMFTMRLWDEFDLVVKLTGATEENEEREEDEADVAFIPRSETILDVSGWVFEFIMLSMPLQHIHPDKEDGSTGCNPEALKLLEKMKVPEGPKKTLWSGLDQFKDLDSAEGKN